MKMLYIMLLLFSLNCYSEEIIVGFEDDDVPVLNEELRKIDTNISDNTASITTNTTNITTNTADIATNTADITTLQNEANVTANTTQVFSGNAPTSMTELDLSAVVGSNLAFVTLKVTNNEGNARFFAFSSVSGGDGVTATAQFGATSIYIPASGGVRYVNLYTDAAGKVYWQTAAGTISTTINMIGYIK